MRELRMVPRSILSWDFRVFEGDRELALLDRKWIREGGTFVLDGATWRIEREGFAGRWKLLTSHGFVHASAEKPSLMWRHFEVTASGRRYTLRPARPFGRPYELLRGTRKVGELAPERPLRRTLRALVPDEIDTPGAVFLAFLVTTIWKRQAAAAAGGG